MVYSPSAIKNVFNILDDHIGSAEFSGIATVKPGYHNSRNGNTSGNYSVQLSYDRQGDPDASAALDFKMSRSDMIKVTNRLRASAFDADDPRMEPVREFYGTRDGSTVYGLIHNSPTGAWSRSSSDTSHLWHVHISFFRKYATDTAKLRGVAEVIIGESEEDTLPSVSDVWNTDNILDTEAMGYGAEYVSSNKGWTPATGLEIAVREARAANAKADALSDKLDKVLAVLAGLSTGAIDADAIVDKLSERLRD